MCENTLKRPVDRTGRFPGKLTADQIRASGDHTHQQNRRPKASRRSDQVPGRQEDQLISVLEAMDQGAYIVNDQYDIEYVNPVLKKEFGPVNGRKCYQYFHNRVDNCPWCKNQQVFEGKTVRWQWHCPRTKRTYDLMDMPLKNADGSTSKLQTLRDITEHKQAVEALRKTHDQLEQRVQHGTADLILATEELRREIAERKQVEQNLRRSQARLANAQRIAQLGNWDWDIVNNDLWWSEQVYQIFGLHPQTFDGTFEAFLSCVHGEDRESVQHSIDAALHRHEPYSIDHRIIRPDGTERIVHEQGEVSYDDHDKPVRMIGTVHDITDQKRAQDALLAERNRLYSVLNMLPGFVVLHTPNDHRLRFVDHVFIDYFGDPGDRPCYSVLRGRSQPCKVCHAKRVLETDEPYQWEWTAPSGQIFNVWGHPFTEADGTHLVLEMGIDITERRKLEKEVLRISASEQQRIGRDLHDSLGQLLTGISFMSELLGRKLADKSVSEAAQAVEISKHVKQALRQVRSLARGLCPVDLEAGGLTRSLQELASSVGDLFGVSCLFQCDGSVIVDDVAVATHVYRIAQEAVNNAIKHGQAKHVWISLTADEDNKTVLKIEDDGIGLPENLDSSEGMGLYIIRYRAGMIGGSLDIHRRFDNGMIVRCSFPGGEVSNQQVNHGSKKASG